MCGRCVGREASTGCASAASSTVRSRAASRQPLGGATRVVMHRSDRGWTRVRGRSSSPPRRRARSTTSQVRALGITAVAAARRSSTRSAGDRSVGTRLVVAPPRPSAITVDWWLARARVRPHRRLAGRAPRAALGGITALHAAGLEGIDDDGLIHVCAPKSSHPVTPPPGVRLHETRRWRDDDVVAVRRSRGPDRRSRPSRPRCGHGPIARPRCCSSPPSSSG